MRGVEFGEYREEGKSAGTGGLRTISMSAPVTLMSNEFARLILRAVFESTEQHLNQVVKVYAQQVPEWRDKWFWELKQCVGPKSQVHMTCDNDWDMYVLCEILKKQFRKIYRNKTRSAMDEDATDILFNQIHQLAYMRNLLQHNADPTVSEMASCVEACCEIVHNFPPPDGDETRYGLVIVNLRRKKEEIDSLLTLEYGMTLSTSISEIDYCLYLLDKMFTLFEKLLGPPIESAIGKKPSKSPPDAQYIVEILMSIPSQKAIRGVFDGRRKPKEKAKFIDTTQEQVDEAIRTAKLENVSPIDKLVFDDIITPEQARDVRTQLGEGKNFNLVKVIRFNIHPYF